MNLLSNFGKRGVSLGLLTKEVDIEDTNYLSKYFVLVEFNPLLTAGKNPISFNGSSLLDLNSEIQVECLDSNGNSLYIERPKSKTQFNDVAQFLLSIHVYNEIYNGAGKLIIVGTTKKGEIVRWIGNINIDKTVQNSSKVRFYNKPTLEVRPLLYPVIDTTAGSQATQEITFNDQCYAYAVNPPRDTNQKYISPKSTNIDYRLVLNRNDATTGPQLYPTLSFNTQMEGQELLLTATSIPFISSYVSVPTSITSSVKIKKVINSTTVQLSEPFITNVNSNNYVTNIDSGNFTSSYTFIAYNTGSDVYQRNRSITESGSVYIKESYSEIVYRNIKPYSGFVARHKLYRKSLLYPGDYTLIADEPLGASELLIDPVSINKNYSLLGTFYNQHHIQKYWFTSSTDIFLSSSVTPFINSMRIYSNDMSLMDGTKYVISKNDSQNSTNDATYYPYDEAQFNIQTGSNYNSNYIDLKGGSLYVLSTNIIIEKERFNKNAKVSFYFTSSIPSIVKEPSYINPFGLKLGEISTNDDVDVKIFSDKQMLFFTPSYDYFGTLVIVPYQCNIILSDLSLKVYGDYGFSPDILFSKIPFKINIANEPFAIKAELFDINSTLVYSDLQAIQSFDESGQSLVISGSTVFDPTQTTDISGSLTVSHSLFVPNISPLGNNIRLLGWNVPANSPPSFGEGSIGYTNISELGIRQGNNISDYARLTTSSSLTPITVTPLSVRYSQADGWGRKIFIDSSGTKFEN